MKQIWNLFMYSFIEILYEKKGQHKVSMVWKVDLVQDEARVQKNSSYSLTMFLHEMCPSSNIGPQNKPPTKQVHDSGSMHNQYGLSRLSYILIIWYTYQHLEKFDEVQVVVQDAIQTLHDQALKMLVSESLGLLQDHYLNVFMC